jgi:hypothetical protein
MAIQASGRRTPSGPQVHKVLWHIYQFIKNLADKHVVVVDKSNGSNWDQSDDSGMADGAWLVLQGAFAVNGKKWQCFIGGRQTAGNLGGFTDNGNVQGLWASFAWEEAWDSDNKTWQAGRLAVRNPNNSNPTLMALNGASGGTFTLVPQIEMAVVERINPETGTVIDSAFIFICTDGTSSQNWYNGLYAGAYHPASPNNLAPRVFFAGKPCATGGSGEWSGQNPQYGRCLDKTASSVADAVIEATSRTGTLITDEDGGYYGEEVLFWNHSAGTKVKGRLIAVHLIDAQAGQGEKMGNGYWIATNRLAFPSKP